MAARMVDEECVYTICTRRGHTLTLCTFENIFRCERGDGRRQAMAKQIVCCLICSAESLVKIVSRSAYVQVKEAFLFRTHISPC